MVSYGLTWYGSTIYHDCAEIWSHMVVTQVLRYDSGSAIRPKNSRLMAPPGFMLRDTADFSGLDVQIFYNLGSYDSPESPLSL